MFTMIPLVLGVFTMRPLSIGFVRYLIYHQQMGAYIAYEIIEEDDDDGYPWNLGR